MASRAVGAYGALGNLTPNIDRLAERGARFTDFYCNSPICCPSRASLFSGRYVSDIGVYDNGAEFTADNPTFLHGLKSSGYVNYLSGKAHFVGPDQLHGFDVRLTREIYPSTFVWTPNWREPVALNNGSNIEQLKSSGECAWSLQLAYDEEVLYRGLEALRSEARLQANGEGRPFFLNLSFTHPHDPFFMTEQYVRRAEAAHVASPRAEWGEVASHPYNEWINRHHGLEEFQLTEPEILQARTSYFAACAYIDDQVGKIIAEIGRLGLTSRTVVVFTADHGEMMGEHGMWFKRTFYDESVRVPFIFSWPGTIPPGITVDTAASLVDLFPTLCEVGGSDSGFLEACSLRGMSLVDRMTARGVEESEPRAIIEYLGEGTNEPLRAIVQNGLKLVEVRNSPSVLFDLKSDPFETVNRSGEDVYQSRETRLRNELSGLWDATVIRQSVIESQTRRRAINRAAYEDQAPEWNWHGETGDRGSVVKNNAQSESVEQRFPRVNK